MSKVSKQKSNQQGHSFVYKRVREGAMLLMLAIGLFFVVALITYNPMDSGWSRYNSSGVIKNAAGVTGAWVADFLFTFFGLLGFAFPLLCVASAVFMYRSFMNSKDVRLLWSVHFIGVLLLLLGGCGFVDLVWPLKLAGSFNPTGGVVGDVFLHLLRQRFGGFGSGLLCLALFMVGVTLSVGLSWFKVMSWVGLQSLNLSKQGWDFTKETGKSVVEGLVNRGDEVVDKFVQRDLRESDFAERVMPKLEPKLDIEDEEIQEKKSVMARTLAVVKPEKITQPLMKAVGKKDVVKRGDGRGDGRWPDLSLLDPATPVDPKKQYTLSSLEQLSREVEERLLDFGAEVKVVAVCPGPIITRFEMTLAPGLKVSKITGLAKDLARSLSVTSVRVVEVIPGKAVVGLEIPNKHREIVRLREVLESPQYQDKEGVTNLALGKDIAGVPVVVNVAQMPHLLIAGTTGSGKSVGVNTMLLSLLFKSTPADLRLILIDPKMLELSVYDGIAHLLTPVVTDMNDAANALRWCVAEMERRYQLMAAVGVRNLAGFNTKVKQSIADGNPLVDPLWEPGSAELPQKLETLPSIVVIIDEFADMMMVVGKKVEELIARIAQKARAAGIHLILATQRPSVDVITGLIKANIPTRIAFQVSSRIDSRTILDQQGAEQLLGHGDMLYLAPGTGIPVRVHGAYVSDDEVHAVVRAIKQAFSAPDYIAEISAADLSVPGIDPIDESGEQDPLYDEAVSIVVQTRKASISYLQRRLKIGYNRSARLIEAMEAAGVVSEMMSNGTREVIAQDVR